MVTFTVSLAEQRALLCRKMAKLENMLLLKRQREKQYQNLLSAINLLEADIANSRQEVRNSEKRAIEKALIQAKAM